MSTNFATPKELRDIAVLMDAMQKTTDRLRRRELSVNLGTISMFNGEGKLLGYMDPTEGGEYSFTSALDADHIVEGMHADPVQTQPMTGAITLPTVEQAHAMAASQPTEPHERREALHSDAQTPLVFADGHR